MNETLKKFDQAFAATHGVAEITAAEWFSVRDYIAELHKEITRLEWRLKEQD